MQAQNRKIQDWYWKIKKTEIKLPRFQRFEAWDRHRVRVGLEHWTFRQESDWMSRALKNAIIIMFIRTHY